MPENRKDDHFRGVCLCMRVCTCVCVHARMLVSPIVDVADQKNDIQVRLGETIVSVGEGTEDDYNLKQTYIMVEGYNPLFGHEFDYDVALLELNVSCA